MTEGYFSPPQLSSEDKLPWAAFRSHCCVTHQYTGLNIIATKLCVQAHLNLACTFIILSGCPLSKQALEIQALIYSCSKFEKGNKISPVTQCPWAARVLAVNSVNQPELLPVRLLRKLLIKVPNALQRNAFSLFSSSAQRANVACTCKLLKLLPEL